MIYMYIFSLILKYIFCNFLCEQCTFTLFPHFKHYLEFSEIHIPTFQYVIPPQALSSLFLTFIISLPSFLSLVHTRHVMYVRIYICMVKYSYIFSPDLYIFIHFTHAGFEHHLCPHLCIYVLDVVRTHIPTFYCHSKRCLRLHIILTVDYCI